MGTSSCSVFKNNNPFTPRQPLSAGARRDGRDAVSPPVSHGVEVGLRGDTYCPQGLAALSPAQAASLALLRRTGALAVQDPASVLHGSLCGVWKRLRLIKMLFPLFLSSRLGCFEGCEVEESKMPSTLFRVQVPATSPSPCAPAPGGVLTLNGTVLIEGPNKCRN